MLAATKLKYFSEDILSQLTSTSVPAEQTVMTVIRYIEQLSRDTPKEEQAAMMSEVATVRRMISQAVGEGGKDARDRANRMHNLYVAYKTECAKERIMLLLTTCNNAAHIVMMNALDEVKKLPEYNARFSLMRKAFNQAEDVWRQYDAGLRHSGKKWLNPSSFNAAQKKRFREDLTAEEYKEFWECIGGNAYLKVKSDVDVLQNKFKLSIESHKIKNAVVASKVLSVSSMLILCEAVYTKTINIFARNYMVSQPEAFDIWKDFNLRNMQMAWGKCVRMMGPVTQLDEMESRNIELTLEQLIDHWNDETFFYSSLIEAAEDFPEIFRTKGEQKKFIRELAETMSNF